MIALAMQLSIKFIDWKIKLTCTRSRISHFRLIWILELRKLTKLPEVICEMLHHNNVIQIVPENPLNSKYVRQHERN